MGVRRQAHCTNGCLERAREAALPLEAPHSVWKKQAALVTKVPPWEQNNDSQMNQVMGIAG